MKNHRLRLFIPRTPWKTVAGNWALVENMRGNRCSQNIFGLPHISLQTGEHTAKCAPDLILCVGCCHLVVIDTSSNNNSLTQPDYKKQKRKGAALQFLNHFDIHSKCYLNSVGLRFCIKCCCGARRFTADHTAASKINTATTSIDGIEKYTA